MSTRQFRTIFRGDGEWFYVCSTWQACNEGNLMLSALEERIWAIDTGWTCSCGKPMNVRISKEQARKDWAEWTRSSPR